MKKVVFIISILLLCQFVVAQVTVFRVTDYSISDTKSKKSSDFKKAEGYLCIYDKENGSIKMLNNAENAWYLSKSNVKIERKEDSDGDRYTSTTYDAVDEEGIECKLLIMEYSNVRTAFIGAVYSNITMSFIMQRL